MFEYSRVLIFVVHLLLTTLATLLGLFGNVLRRSVKLLSRFIQKLKEAVLPNCSCKSRYLNHVWDDEVASDLGLGGSFPGYSNFLHKIVAVGSSSGYFNFFHFLKLDGHGLVNSGRI